MCFLQMKTTDLTENQPERAFQWVSFWFSGSAAQAANSHYEEVFTKDSKPADLVLTTCCCASTHLTAQFLLQASHCLPWLRCGGWGRYRSTACSMDRTIILEVPPEERKNVSTGGRTHCSAHIWSVPCRCIQADSWISDLCQPWCLVTI